VRSFFAIGKVAEAEYWAPPRAVAVLAHAMVFRFITTVLLPEIGKVEPLSAFAYREHK
jgi:hypothetical protein